MKKILVFLVISFTLFASGREKRISEVFPVEPGADIIFETISGMDIEIVGSPNSEVVFDLTLDFDSSDKDYEKRFMEDFEIIELKKSGVHKFKFSKTDEDGGWNFFDLFKLKFSYYENISLRGTITIPENAKFTSDFRYGDIILTGLKNEIILKGKGNELKIFNCLNLKKIENAYGGVDLSDCGGDLRLNTRSDDVKVNFFEGNLTIDADYSDIKVSSVAGDLSIKSRSAEIRVENISGTAKIHSDYSDINLSSIAVLTEVKSRSGTLLIDKGELHKVITSYMEIDLRNIANPEEVDLYIENKSGTIRLDRVTSHIKIVDQYSDLTFLKVKGNLDISSRSGSIIGDEVEGNIISNTQYSSLEFRKLSADKILIKNRSNPVELELNNLPSVIDIDNEYGGAYIKLKVKFGGKIKLYSTYGEIETNLPYKVVEQSSSQNLMEIVEGGKSDVIIKTRSGDIEFYELN
ncbi:MAG: hypothetical protein SCALA702_14520 [Melioribacteraceae bacterium]|nr:MAG: hypothetical protein SCALA702_14520 [Melioribacteraceae bacterium]